MSIYQKIFATTSRRFASSGLISKQMLSPERLLWAFPAGLAATWFIWGALTDDIKQSVGLYWDPEADMNKVEMERAKRMEAKAALKAASRPAKSDDDDEDDDEEEDVPPAEEDEEEEEVTAEDISAAVAKAVEASGDDEEEEEEEEDEEEEEEKPKKPKVDVSKLSSEEKWDYFAEISIVPGEDDEDEEEEDDDVSFVYPKWAFLGY
jgi:hypothetical protein